MIILFHQNRFSKTGFMLNLVKFYVRTDRGHINQFKRQVILSISAHTHISSV